MSETNFEQAQVAFEHLRAGRLAEAETVCREILGHNPSHPEGLHLFGLLAAHMGRTEVAHSFMQRAADANPGSPDVANNFGIVLETLGHFDEANIFFSQALRLRPDFPEAHYNLGKLLQKLGQLDEAIAEYRRSTELKPTFAEAFNNLGHALQLRSRPGEAMAACEEALRLRPDYAAAFNNLGNAYKDQGRLDRALECFRKALALRPEAADIQSNLVCSVQYHPAYDAAAILAEAREWNRRHAGPMRATIRDENRDPDPGRRLRIGYISPDFRRHVVGFNLLPWLREHDHQRFEIFAYADLIVPDEVTREVKFYVDVWRPIAGLSDDAVAELIRRDGIDILVDLTLHLAGNRLLVFARKPAPVQVTYLGYCGTTGMDAMDYRLSDPHFDPPDQPPVCNEKTIRLPRSFWCYQPAGPTPDVSPLPASKNRSVTFGCLNNFAKVSEPALETWMEILAAVPKSRLMLYAPLGLARESTLARAARRNVSSDRLEFLEKQSFADYFATWGRIDIALDPFPYCGGITSCDALWMGAPLVTLAGRTTVGRSGCSILANIGLLELVAETPEQYAQIAVSLAKDLPRLAELRATLRRLVEQSPLRDPGQHARDVEAAFREMWREWCARRTA